MKKLLLLIGLSLLASLHIIAQVTPPIDDVPDIPTISLPTPEVQDEFDIDESAKVDSLLDQEIIDTLDVINTPVYAPLGIYGHDFLRTSNYEFYRNATGIKANEDYILGPGDELTVTVWNQDNVISDNYVVSNNGAIERQLLGRIFVEGLPLNKARDIIKSRYKRSYEFEDSSFDVAVSGIREITVDVVGEVEVPGSYTFPAVNTVINLLKLAGGPTATGTAREILITRNGKTAVTIDIYDYLGNPNFNQDIFLQHRDIVRIGSIGNVVTVEGQVKKPYKYELKRGENLNSMLEYAGGLQADAYKNSINIYRYENDEYVLKTVASSDIVPMLDGDLVVVDQIRKNVLNMVTVVGSVNSPGTYQVNRGDRISDVISKASGLSYDAYVDRAYIRRPDANLEFVNIVVDIEEALAQKGGDADVIIYPQDELKIMSKRDFTTDYEVEIFGEVKNPGIFRLSENFTLQDLIIVSGGFTEQAESSSIELRRVVDYEESEGRNVPRERVAGDDKGIEIIDVDFDFLSENQDRIDLQPYDQIFVRALPAFNEPEVIEVVGEVTYPGMYPMVTKNMRVSDLIENSGGLTTYAYSNAARFYRKEDGKGSVVIDLNEIERNKSSKYNYVLKPGDRLEVPTMDEIVTISGAIRNVLDDKQLINTAFHGHKNAKWYIDEFGAGFDKKAWRSSTQVLDPNGKLNGTRKFLFFNVYPDVEPGSTIQVAYKPEKIVDPDRKGFFQDFDLNSAVAIVAGLTTTALAVIAATK